MQRMVPESRRRRNEGAATDRDAQSPELRQNGCLVMPSFPMRLVALCTNVLALLLANAPSGHAQVAPSTNEQAGYGGLFAAAARGDAAAIARLSAAGADIKARDGNRRTPLTTPAPSLSLAGAMEARPTLLLVDDEESVQKLLAYPLEREGYRVVQARDGEEALVR